MKLIKEVEVQSKFEKGNIVYFFFFKELQFTKINDIVSNVVFKKYKGIIRDIFIKNGIIFYEIIQNVNNVQIEHIINENNISLEILFREDVPLFLIRNEDHYNVRELEKHDSLTLNDLRVFFYEEIIEQLDDDYIKTLIKFSHQHLKKDFENIVKSF